MKKNYIGRFAPSPSGPLHFGSLVAAVGSYLQAKSQNGKWLVRMEDLDPPREIAGAADNILRTLDAFKLQWDDQVIYQSHRHQVYQQQVDLWLEQQAAYFCQCTRKAIKQSGDFYQGTCRDLMLKDDRRAVRLKMMHPVESFIDRKLGSISINPLLANEDFIIKRSDGLFAYNLAVVIDDIEQGITEVVRGADLIEPTGRQISLYRQLGYREIDYLHLPLAVDEDQKKLSKQNHAPAVDIRDKKKTLLQVFRFLGLEAEDSLKSLDLEQMLQWAVDKWQISLLPNESKITLPF
ncbi:MAG: tRNA glutamyl-Q(34) synthetase GluQRS [Aliivibrio sp.]|uniref:tRNA glutamyl-Q(34) synthetase GluQRS n=1 Tax=Aliivibrio sp. TaxID=1872443 RepID=UPI001A44CCEA|nr:tRNA glutamyl-Q(34) synthetase GluQRS [Aliivibrio sp.]